MCGDHLPFLNPHAPWLMHVILLDHWHSSVSRQGCRAAKPLPLHKEQAIIASGPPPALCTPSCVASVGQYLTSAVGVQALDEVLQPRMALMGQMAVLDEFKSVFPDTLHSGDQVLLLWNTGSGTLDVKLLPADGSRDYASVCSIFHSLTGRSSVS
jgi:hypothetical protein